MRALFDRVLSFFKQTNGTAHTQTYFLQRLPTELVLLICAHLSYIDTTCLALCCHAALFKIGQDSLLFSKIKDSDERKEFLTRISRDIPAYYFCHSCFNLHEWASVSMPWLSNKRSWARCVYYDEFPSLSMIMGTNRRVPSSYFLRFVHLQLAMRIYHYGPEYGIPADCLDYVEVSQPYHGDGVTTLLRVEARICPQQEDSNESSLCLRNQQCAIMPCFDTNFASLSDFVDMRVCELLLNSARNQMVALCELESPGSFSSQQSTYQCPRCRVDFEFRFSDVEDRLAGKARALLITKWLDLGDGIDPKDSLWFVHVSASPEKDSRYRKVGSVRSRFESQSGLSQEEFTSQNKQRLDRENFRYEIYGYTDEMWIGL